MLVYKETYLNMEEFLLIITEALITFQYCTQPGIAQSFIKTVFRV